MEDLSQFIIFLSSTLVLTGQSWMVEAVASVAHPELLQHGEFDSLHGCNFV
jgi:hypothetical protein